MSGVEILAVEEVAVAFGFDWSVFIPIAVVFSILFSLFGILIATMTYEKGAGVFAAIGVFFGIVLGFVSETGAPTKFETHYKVTISEEVPMIEFFERYEIIEQEGKIYTIREVD